MDDKEQMSEYGKLKSLLGAYEKILHPDIFNPILKQIEATYEESKKQAYAAAKISDDALWIEAKMIDMKARHLRIYGDRKMTSFSIKCFYKELLKKFEVSTIK